MSRWKLTHGALCVADDGQYVDVGDYLQLEQRIAELEAKVDRLTSRGIEDMKDTIEQQQAQLDRLREAAKRVLADYKKSRSDEMFTGISGHVALKYSTKKLQAALAAALEPAEQGEEDDG